jgi:hypothetical protein
MKKQIIRNDSLEKGKDFEINTSNLIFYLKGTRKERSLFTNILIKEMIFEWLVFSLLSL